MDNNIKVYSSLSRKLQIFSTLEKNIVKMYACGITVYDDMHIGHAMQAIVFDVIRRYLEYIGYEVKYIRNFTDIDDKIIKKANELNKNFFEISNYYINESKKELQILKVRPATYEPKVTDHINDIIDFIQDLINKNFAYVSNGEVFFEVKKFKEYGKLSNRNINELINPEETPNKKNPQDFCLWKSAKKNEPSWDSPWGPGRPGWHIECSAMIYHYLGEQIDIHGGGIDLIFPHHENEIAQMEAKTNKQFARYWLHNGLVMINGEKMSKSLNNFITVKDALNKYHPDVIRYLILSHHYQSTINFSDELFKIAEKRIYYFYKTLKRIDEFLNSHSNYNINNTNNILPDFISNIEKNFINSMNNNFNTALVIANISNLFNDINKYLDDLDVNIHDKINSLNIFKQKFTIITNILSILDEKPNEVLSYFKKNFLSSINITEDFINGKIQMRINAKKEKKFDVADKIRDELKNIGILVQDTKEGDTIWDINL